MRTIAANSISLVACTLMVLSGCIQSKKKTLTLQTIQIGLSAVSYGILMAYPGMIINLLSLPRNILAQKNKLYFRYKITLLIVTITLSFIFAIQNDNGQKYVDWIKLIPLVSTIAYTLLMDKVNDINFKRLVIFTMIIWITHDFAVQNYVSVAFNTMNIMTSLSAIYRLTNISKKPPTS